MASLFKSFVNWSNPNGKIAVITEKPYYVSGEVIRGRIYAQIFQPIECNGVLFRVKGVEKAEWAEERSRLVQVPNSNPPEHVTEYWLERGHGKRVFFDHKVLVNRVQGLLMPGNYEFPFEYALPGGLPGTFYEMREMPSHNHYVEQHYGLANDWYDSDDEDVKVMAAPAAMQVNMGGFHIQVGAPAGNQYFRRWMHPYWRASVLYKVEATLDVNGFFARDIYARQPIIVREALLQNIQAVHQETTQTVCLCCCIPRGQATLKVWFDKNCYAPGEQADIKADILNSSSSDIGNMVVRLYRVIELRGDFGASSRYIEDLVSEARYAGVPSGQHTSPSLPLALDPNLQPSTNGQVVKAHYRLDVVCDISWAPDIEVHLPVVLYAPQPNEWAMKPLF